MLSAENTPILIVSLGYLVCSLLAGLWVALWFSFEMKMNGAGFHLNLGDYARNSSFLALVTAITGLPVFAFHRWFFSHFSSLGGAHFGFIWAAVGSVIWFVFGMGLEPTTQGFTQMIKITTLPGFCIGLVYYLFEKPWLRKLQ